MEESWLLKCHTCESIFKDPRLLPCQHTLCYKPCLVDLLNSAENRRYSCPICHEEHVLPVGGTESFSKSTIIQELLDVFNKHNATISSARKARVSLSSDEYRGSLYRSIEVSSEEANTSGLLSICIACTKEHNTCQLCLHCGDKVCKSCYNEHFGLIKAAVLDFKGHIDKAIAVLKEKQELTSFIVKENRALASDGDLKMLFLVFEQIQQDMGTFLSSVESIIEKNDDNTLIATMFQAEEHLLALNEIEINPMILGLPKHFEQHQEKSLKSTKNQRKTGIDSQQPDVYSNERQSQPVPLIEQEPTVGKNQNICRNIQDNLATLNVGKNVIFSVRLVAMVISCVRFGIGALVAMQGSDIVKKTAGSILMAKSVIDLGFVVWVLMDRFRTDLKSNFKAAFGSFLVLLNCLSTIIATIFAYAPVDVMNMCELALRVAVGFDCVWSFLILITMLFIIHKAFNFC